MSGLRREIAIFFVVGCSTVLLDFILYHLLLQLGAAYVPAKIAGFVTGSVFSYFANRRWTFGFTDSLRRSAARFALLYGCTLLANVASNEIALWALPITLPGRVTLAFLFATGVSTVLNFLGMKFIVFRRSAA